MGFYGRWLQRPATGLRDVRRSFQDTACLRLAPDKTVLLADGRNLVFLDISAYDKGGDSGDGFRLQGFCFTKRRKEFLETSAADNRRLYGNQYTIEENAITGTGNNVMLEFGEFDFIKEQPSALEITGSNEGGFYV